MIIAGRFFPGPGGHKAFRARRAARAVYRAHRPLQRLFWPLLSRWRYTAVRRRYARWGPEVCPF